MIVKNITKYGMLALAYQVMNYLEKNGGGKLEWNDYHNFPIADIPYEWYEKTMQAIGAKKKDFTLQIGQCLPVYFINLQNPPLMDEYGHDDYYELDI